jgi:ParB-like nuclease domain
MIGTRRKPEERRIQHVRLDRLHPHPLNEKIYGAVRPDQKLIDSIRALGILEPLIVTQRGLIISGHSRWQAAKIICAEDGTSEKTVYLMTMRPDHSPNDAWYADEDRLQEEDDNPLILERMIIEANRQRVKTAEQKAREFTELKRIEAALAKQRQKQGRENLPHPESAGKARDKAAEVVGLSGKTAEKLEAIVVAADAGDTTAKNALAEIDRKNGRGVDSAYRAVVVPTPKPAQNPELKAALERHVAKARELNAAVRSQWSDAEVVRSAKADMFHLTLRNLTQTQVTEIVASVKKA